MWDRVQEGLGFEDQRRKLGEPGPVWGALVKALSRRFREGCGLEHGLHVPKSPLSFLPAFSRDIGNTCCKALAEDYASFKNNSEFNLASAWIAYILVTWGQI